MLFYIDPGTGSMLFAIMIGVLSAAIYLLRNVLVKAKFMFSGGKAGGKDDSRVPYALFSDSKRYWSIFKPICDEMEKREETVLYLTADEDDPLLQEKYEHIRTEFAGNGNKAFARLNMLKADIVLSTTPGLDVYQWKRSRDVKRYAHVMHGAYDVTLYRMFGCDYFDAMLLSGEYQAREVRELEKLRRLPEKEIRLVGLPNLDFLQERLKEAPPRDPDHETTVLLAPSWGPSGILNRYGKKIIDVLIATGYRLIIRPHPQSFVSEKEMIEPLMTAFPDSGRIKWDRSIDNFDVLYESDILISDFSGVIFDYALVFDKPIIYADVSFDNGIYDSWWLGGGEWMFSVLDKLGLQLTEKNTSRIGELIRECMENDRFRGGREQVRAETWVNRGHSIEAIADYLVKTETELSRETGLPDSEERIRWIGLRY